MRALVTGAGGMLGQALCAALRQEGHDVHAVPHAEADVTDISALRHAAGSPALHYVFHLAALTRVDECEGRPDDAFRVNGLGARNAALVAAERGASVLYVSTDYVFDGRARSPYREYDPTAPLSVYGASKLAGEQAVREVTPRHFIVRTSWLFGPGGPNFVDSVLQRAEAGETLRVVDDQRGSPTFTADLAPALERIAVSELYGTYHVTNRGECTWHELAARVLERRAPGARLEKITSAALGRPAVRPAYSVLSNLFYEASLGPPLPDWQDALERHLRAAGKVPA
jgi:dTDP-4-dehydrorhamnose reductase